MSFRREYEMNPKAIPSVMLKVKGMMMIVKYAGMASVRSSHLIKTMHFIIR
jgi:hypothetical protein